MAYNSGGAPAGSTTSLAALHGDDAVLKLIDVVKAEEVLWNYTEVPRDAESVRQLADAWDRVTELMMTIYPKASRTVLRTTWKSLRHRHRRRGFTNTGNYKWRDHMAFLNEVVEPLDESSPTTQKPASRKRRSAAPLPQSYDGEEEVDDSDLPFTFSQSPNVGNGPKPTKVARQTSANRDYYGTIIGVAASSSDRPAEEAAAATASTDSASRKEYGNASNSVFSPMELLVAKVEAEDSSSDTSASGNVVEADIPNESNDENNLFHTMDLTTLASRWSADENAGIDDHPTSITELDQDYNSRGSQYAQRDGAPRSSTNANAMNKLNSIRSEFGAFLKPTPSSFVAQLAASAHMKQSYAFGDLICDRMQALANGPARWRAEGQILTAVEKIVADLCKENSSISN